MPEDAKTLPADAGPVDRLVMALEPKRAVLEPRLRRLLERMAAGETPRCSGAEFEALWKVLPGLLQRESRYGADRSGGYVLTPLHRGDEQRVADWLRHNVPMSRAHDQVAEARDAVAPRLDGRVKPL